MMNILILIDNVIQYERIKVFLNEKNYKNTKFTICHSPGNSPIKDHIDFKLSKNHAVDVHKEVDNLIDKYNLIISIHCLQFFPEKLVNSVKCINIHPGYNPDNRGWYPQVFAIIHNLKIGATIHEMDEKLDNGPIIVREEVTKYIWDTSETLYNRILEKEMELFEQNIEKIISHNYSTILPTSKGNIFSKNDFSKMCHLNLNQKGTFLHFYNLLRALSHGKYHNAYFIDEETQKKVFLKLQIINE